MLLTHHITSILVKFHDKREWLNGFNPDNEGDLLWYTDSPRPIKALLVLGCMDGPQEGGTASVLGSTPWYSGLKYMRFAPKVSVLMIFLRMNW